MLQIHPNARTTPAVRAEIARSDEPSGVLAKRYGVSTDTVRKWRKRGPEDCLDRSAKPHKLPWKATEEERAVVCALRRATDFALDDLTFVVSDFLPHLNRDSVWRILRAEGLNRRPPPSSGKPARGQGTFRASPHPIRLARTASAPCCRPPGASGRAGRPWACGLQSCGCAGSRWCAPGRAAPAREDETRSRRSPRPGARRDGRRAAASPPTRSPHPSTRPGHPACSAAGPAIPRWPPPPAKVSGRRGASARLRTPASSGPGSGPAGYGGGGRHGA